MTRTKVTGSDDGSQSDKFKEAACQLETDDDPERFNERLGKLVKHKPVEKSGVRLLLLLAALSAPAMAQELPPIPEDLLNVVAVTCVKMNNSGRVVGAYLIRSTGNVMRDRGIVDWVKGLHWGKAKPGDKLRNVWFPMPVAFGDVPAPDLPKSCSAVDASTPTAKRLK